MRLGFRLRHNRYRRFERLRYQDRLLGLLNARATVFDGTGTARTFTAAVTASSGTLTLTDNMSEGETVTLDGVVYTAVESPVEPGEFARGLTASLTLDNLIDEINGDGIGDAHPTVTAAAGAGDTVVVTARIAGVAGDLITTATTAADGAWGDNTLTGGVSSNVLTSLAHGLSVGDGPFLAISSGTLPGGLVDGAPYWVDTVPTGNTLTVTAVRGGGGAVALTSPGTGTRQLVPYESASGVFALTRYRPLAAILAATDIDTLTV